MRGAEHGSDGASRPCRRPEPLAERGNWWDRVGPPSPRLQRTGRDAPATVGQRHGRQELLNLRDDFQHARLSRIRPGAAKQSYPRTSVRRRRSNKRSNPGMGSTGLNAAALLDPSRGPVCISVGTRTEVRGYDCYVPAGTNAYRTLQAGLPACGGIPGVVGVVLPLDVEPLRFLCSLWRTFFAPYLTTAARTCFSISSSATLPSSLAGHAASMARMWCWSSSSRTSQTT